MSDSESATYMDRVRLAQTYRNDNPYMAMAPVGVPSPEALKDDVVFNGEYIVVPFGGPGESGWAVWFFKSEALRRAFTRRYQHARELSVLSRVTGLARLV